MDCATSEINFFDQFCYHIINNQDYLDLYSLHKLRLKFYKNNDYVV